MPAITLDTPPAVGSAQDLLARLERYAAARRATTGAAIAATRAPAVVAARHPEDVLLPAPHAPRYGAFLRGIDPATADLFPYDLVASIVGCVATVMAGAWFGRAEALVFTAGLAGCGEWARQRRWFPSAAANLIIGALIGVLLVVIS